MSNRKGTGQPPELPFPIVGIEPAGSRYTVNPPPTGTDEDWIVLIPEGADLFEGAVEPLDEACWKYGGSAIEDESAVHTTFRDGDVNLIITNSREYFRRFIIARDICKQLNLVRKEDRVYVHRRVRDDMDGLGPVQQEVEGACANPVLWDGSTL